MNKNLLRAFILNYNKLTGSIRLAQTNATATTTSESKKRLVDYLTSNTQSANALKYYDPPYLSREPPFPNYDELNMNFKGYDYVSLNVFYKYVEKLCNSLNVNVVSSYAVPAQSLKVKTLVQFSSKLDKEFDLNIYHRVVRVKGLKSTMAPLLFEAVQLNLPEGVQMSVSAPTAEEDDYRYVPDIELNELRERLEDYAKKPKETTAETPATPAAAAATTPAAAAKAATPATKAAPTPSAKPATSAPSKAPAAKK